MKNNNKFPAKFLTLFALAATVAISSCKKEEQLPVDVKLQASAQKALNKNSVSYVPLSDSAYQAVSIGRRAFYLEKALPTGYVKNGTVDYTKYVQQAISKNTEVIFPAFPILVNKNGLMVRSDRTLTFLKGSEIRLKASNDHSYRIFNIANASNVVLNNPVIIGDRTEHIGQGGRAGVGLGIYSSTNIVINNPQIFNCWGDGIYIGRSSSKSHNKNIQISNAYVSDAGRNGMSVITVDGLKVNKGYFANSGLTGLDIEGNYGDEEIKNITLENITTDHNSYNGLTIALSRTFDKRDKSVGEIKVVNHRDIASRNYSFKSTVSAPAAGMGKIGGIITLVNPTWENPGSGRPNFNSISQKDLKVKIQKPSVFAGSRKLTDVECLKLIKLNIKKNTEVEVSFN